MDTPSSQARNSKYGLILFSIYAVFYLGFVFVNAFAATWVEWVPFLGLNLAIIWGFGLIALALILALVYGFLCWSPAKEVSNSKSGDKL